MVPKRRLNEVIERERRDAAIRIADLERRLAETTRPPATPPAQTPPAEPPNPQDDAIRNRLLGLFPDLKHLSDVAKLAARTGDIDATIQANQRYTQAEQQYYDAFTGSQLLRLHDSVAAALLGDGKKGSDLSPMAADVLNTAFYKWVTNESHPERVQRYDRLDVKLIDEFYAEYRSTFIDPVRRSTSATTQATLEGRPRLPVGGTTPPSAPVPPKPTAPGALEDEDAVHNRAWQAALALQAQG